jgi:hypothetical protein
MEKATTCGGFDSVKGTDGVYRLRKDIPSSPVFQRTSVKEEHRLNSRNIDPKDPK